VIPLRRMAGPLEESPFRLLWLARASSDVGNALLPVALAFAVLELTGSASDLGLVLAAALIPRVALLLVGGVWADRLPRQRLMLACDLVRAASQGALAVLFIAGVAELWHMVVGAAVYGVAQAFFGPASTAIVPQTVSPERLQPANALISLTRSSLLVAGPALGGLLIVAFGPGWVFAVDSFTFVVSAACLALLRLPRQAGRRAQSFAAELASGWREVTSRSWVWASILFFSLWNLAIAPFYVLGPLVAERELGGASDWGIVLAGSGIGAIAGGATALRLRPRRPLLVAFVLSLLTALEPAALIPPLPALGIAGATVLGVTALTIANTLWLTALQENIPSAVLSRVSAYELMVSSVLMPLGYVLAGPLADSLGLDATLALASALIVAASVGVVLVPGVRRLTRKAGSAPTGPPEIPPSAMPPPAEPRPASTPL